MATDSYHKAGSTQFFRERAISVLFSVIFLLFLQNGERYVPTKNHLQLAKEYIFMVSKNALFWTFMRLLLK